MMNQLSSLLSKLQGHSAIVTSTVLFVSVTALACKFHVTKRLSDCERENTTRHGDPRNRGRHRQPKKRPYEGVNDSELSNDVFPSHLQRELYKEERREVMRPLITMKRPMYDNIMMMSLQGSNLSTISLKKAKWYVQKGLAIWLTNPQGENGSVCRSRNDEADNTFTGSLKIQLLFEHSSVTTKDATLQAYNASVKQNCCVACGADRDYMRHYIVPYCYRTHFPDHYKTHMPHDVVLLCPPCHAEAEGRTHRRMHQLEQRLRSSNVGSRLHPTSAQAELVDKHVYNVRSAATALLQWKDKLPVTKIAIYESRVRDWYVSRHTSTAVSLSSGSFIDLTETILTEASQLESRRPNPDFIPGADFVIASLQTSNDTGRRDLCKAALARFIREWRQHFLDGLHPRHLPDGWGVDTAVHCDRRSEDD